MSKSKKARRRKKMRKWLKRRAAMKPQNDMDQAMGEFLTAQARVEQPMVLLPMDIRDKDHGCSRAAQVSASSKNSRDRTASWPRWITDCARGPAAGKHHHRRRFLAEARRDGDNSDAVIHFGGALSQGSERWGQLRECRRFRVNNP
jgi:hypothetical protein